MNQIILIKGILMTYENRKVFVFGLDEHTAEEWQMNEKGYEEFLKHNEQEATIQNVECLVDGEFDHDYYNIVFSDGYKVVGIHGYHLQLLSEHRYVWQDSHWETLDTVSK
jgi:hypothetical protein